MKRPMTAWFALAFCMAVIMSAADHKATAASHTGQESAGVPKAVVAEKAFAFEGVIEGDVVTHAYIIENQGTAPLKVLKVRTSCGCTTARRPETIAPGAQDQIVVKGNTQQYGGRVFNKTITVSTNDPQQPQIQLQLKGSVALFARIEPPKLTLTGRVGETLEAQAMVTPNPDRPFRITTVKPDSRLADKIDVRLDQQKGGYLIVVHNRMAIPGQYRGQVVIDTDNAAHPRLTLFIVGRIAA